MTFLLFEILGSLIFVSVLAFAFGWFARGLRERFEKGNKH